MLSTASGTTCSAGASSPSVDNFGVLGERPTHPELLDYLADDFVRDGWSLKTLIRSLVLTGAYQMSSRPDPAADDGRSAEPAAAPDANIRRLEGEAIRDAMLAVSGRLDPTMFGPPVPVSPDGVHGRPRPAEASGPLDGDGRRSIYLAVRRNFLSPLLLAFDTPTAVHHGRPADRVERAGPGADPDERPVRAPAGRALGPAGAGQAAGPADERIGGMYPAGVRPAADGRRKCAIAWSS